MRLSVIILSFNSAATIGATVAAAAQVAEEIYLVDSGSTDQTLAEAQANYGGLRICTHSFVNYGEQRNWAIGSLPFAGDWELHLDADEILSPELIAAIQRLKSLPEPQLEDGYLIPRQVVFMGRTLRHGGMYPIWHLRLFRRGVGRCEARLYDQHFVLESQRLGRLKAPMIDRIAMGLDEWTERHNRWASAEAAEYLRQTSRASTVEITPSFTGTAIERKRAWRSAYDQLPHFTRGWLLFLYRYIVRFGFLDGREGLIFFVLQCFWFRFLVDAKIYERRQRPAP
ncbi:MAG: glycosyltransferase family 2 protein [Alphaproteobacteria bacterium]|nr:glycosyltransferase family 2 protein [Alphaproteobacteria bacterium]